jgi:hypothetical protein
MAIKVKTRLPGDAITCQRQLALAFESDNVTVTVKKQMAGDAARTAEV